MNRLGLRRLLETPFDVTIARELIWAQNFQAIGLQVLWSLSEDYLISEMDVHIQGAPGIKPVGHLRVTLNNPKMDDQSVWTDSVMGSG